MRSPDGLAHRLTERLGIGHPILSALMGFIEETGVFMSEAVGLIRDAPPVAQVIGRIVAEAEWRLGNAGGFVVA